jgi:hypothetical protein
MVSAESAQKKQREIHRIVQRKEKGGAEEGWRRAEESRGEAKRVGPVEFHLGSQRSKTMR